jgi:alkyl hydroperoxide reductase subunit AhpC
MMSSSKLFVRKRAPEFNAVAVQDQKTIKVNLDQFKGKYLIMLFYPFDFTFVCPTELIAFSERLQEFKELNTEILGVSTDSHFSHMAWLKTPRNEGGIQNLSYPLISDFSKSISKDYGFLVEDDKDELDGAALRGLALIDGTGIVKHIQINDEGVGRSVDEALRLVQAFRFTEEHGEVCPANWKPGKKAMKPTQE